MFISAAEYVNGIAFELLFVVEPLEEGIGLVFTGSEGKHVVNRDDKE
jgi:hypothetical protein